MNLPKPHCQLGYTEDQIKEIVIDLNGFYRWMEGQTMAVCDGRLYDHEKRCYVEGCGPHGIIVYPHDLERYLQGLPVID